MREGFVGTVVRLGSVRIGAVAVAAIQPVFCSSAFAEPVREASRTGRTVAVLNYERQPGPDVDAYSDFTLAISRQGRRLVRETLRPTCGECDISPGGRRRSVRVRDLTGDGEPEVVVDLYAFDWGRSDHAFFYSYVYSFVAADNGGAGGYRRAKGKFGWRNANYRLRDLGHDGTFEFVDEDDRFALAFTLSGDSRFPIQIWRIENRRFREVTKRYPGTIARHARMLWRTQDRRLRENRAVDGVLAAYMADLYLINRSGEGWQRLRQLASRGLLREDVLGGESWERYLRRLKRFLRRTGYAP